MSAYFDSLAVGDSVVLACGICECEVDHPYTVLDVIESINDDHTIARINDTSYSLSTGAVLSGVHYLDPAYCLLDPDVSLDARYFFAALDYDLKTQLSIENADFVSIEELLSSEKRLSALIDEVFDRG